MPTEPEPEADEPEKKPARKRSLKPSKPLGSIYPGQKIKSKTETEHIPFETPEELASRLKREEADARNERIKGLVTYAVFAILLTATTFACLYVVVFPSQAHQPDTLKLASTLLTAIVSGGASFFAGKAAGKGESR